MALDTVVLAATVTLYTVPEQVTGLMYWLDTWDGYTVFLGVRGCPVAFRNRGQLPLSNPSTCIISWMAVLTMEL